MQNNIPNSCRFVFLMVLPGNFDSSAGQKKNFTLLEIPRYLHENNLAFSSCISEQFPTITRETILILESGVGLNLSLGDNA